MKTLAACILLSKVPTTKLDSAKVHSEESMSLLGFLSENGLFTGVWVLLPQQTTPSMEEGFPIFAQMNPPYPSLPWFPQSNPFLRPHVIKADLLTTGGRE